MKNYLYPEYRDIMNSVCAQDPLVEEFGKRQEIDEM